MMKLGWQDKAAYLMDRLAPIACVVVDTRVGGVVVPEDHRGVVNLQLNLSHKFGTALTMDEHGVHQSLSFKTVWIDVHLPWDSIYIMFVAKSAEPRPVIDFSCLPMEIVAQLLDLALGEPMHGDPELEPERAPEPPVKPRGGLQLVKGGGS